MALWHKSGTVDQIPPSAAFGFLPTIAWTNWLNQELNSNKTNILNKEQTNSRVKSTHKLIQKQKLNQIPPSGASCHGAYLAIVAKWLHLKGKLENGTISNNHAKIERKRCNFTKFIYVCRRGHGGRGGCEGCLVLQVISRRGTRQVISRRAKQVISRG